MSKRNKIVFLIFGILIVAAAVGFTIHQRNRNVTTVQTSRASREALTATVSASGEIRPDLYVNIGANAFGKIVKLYVQEGERVKKDQLLAQIENVQSNADVAATRAQLEAARTDSLAAAAGLNTAQANLDRARAEAQRARLDYQRSEQLFGEKLIPKSEFDGTKAAWEGANAAVDQAQAQVAQSKAQQKSAESRISQFQATLTRATDVLDKTDLHRTLRRRDHQPAGTRRRDRGHRHPELSRHHSDDPGQHVGHQRRGKRGRNRHRQRRGRTAG